MQCRPRRGSPRSPRWGIFVGAWLAAACGTVGTARDTGLGDSSGSSSGTASASSSSSSGGGSTSGSTSGAGRPGSGSGGESDAGSDRGGGIEPVDASARPHGDASVPLDAGADAAGGPGPAMIQNDVFWRDTSGNQIDSQGGGVLQVGPTYYWYGVQYGGAAAYAGNERKNNDTSFVAVPCYSSTDLVRWKFEGNALTAASIGASGWVGRLGAAYNAATRNYVLVMQYNGSHGSGELFATSATPNGAFAFDNVQATIANVVSGTSGDQAVFNDDDGQAYLVFSNSNGRSHLYVAPLRPADFLAVQAATQVYSSAAGGREGNCMFKYAGRYYLNSSDLHGWNASHTYYISAANITGPYSAEAVIGRTDADYSHVTQSGLFVAVHGSAQTTIVFGGDRWSDFAGNGIGFNQWVPLTFDDAAPSMASLSQWSIDVATGTWSVGPKNNYALNPSFEADRVAVAQPAGWTVAGAGSAGPGNLTGGHTGNWKWRLVGPSSSVTQAVSGLPDGTYTLGAWMQNGGPTAAQLFAKDCGGAAVVTSVAAGTSGFTQVTAAGIAVSGGACQIGAALTPGASANQSLDVDDFTLIRD